MINCFMSLAARLIYRVNCLFDCCHIISRYKDTKKNAHTQHARADFYAKYPLGAKFLRKLPFLHPLTGTLACLSGKDLRKDVA